MQRREFIGLTGAAAAAWRADAAPQPSLGSGRLPNRPSGLKLGCQSGPSNDRHFAYFARYGVRNICARPVIDDASRLYATVEELSRLRNMAERHGLTVDMTDSVLLPSSLIDAEPHPSIMLGVSPQRDRDIEAFQQLIVNCSKVGIPAVKYNLSILGVLRNVHVAGRGDADYAGWDWSAAHSDAGLTRAGVVNEETFWERISYFLDRVVPVAAEYKVRIACHPHDPGVPPSGYRGVHRVLGTVAGLKKFVALNESAYHGLNFCQGTVAENLVDPATEIYDVIRYFGSRKKIFNVHIRNIRGHRDKFLESFPDDGDVDMLAAVMTYKEVGYQGMLMPDHVPLVGSKRGGDEYAYNYGGSDSDDDGHLESFAFAYGYIRGLIQAADKMS